MTMGSVLCRVFDPPAPDPSIRDFWHVDGVIVDAAFFAPGPRTGSTSLEVGEKTTTSNGINQQQTAAVLRRRKSRGFVPKVGCVQRRPPGVLFVYEGELHYRSRLLRNCWTSSVKPLRIEVCDILDVNFYSQFTSQKDGKVYTGKIVDIQVMDLEGNPNNTVHIGFFTKQADQVSKQLKETFSKHRQKPRIFQFNSFDVEGIEIEVP